MNPNKYKFINFVPPVAVSEAAVLGLLLRAKYKRGGTLVGVMRARDLKNRKKLSALTIKRMVSFFARHEVDKRARNWGNNENPSPGYIAWLLWGGDDGWQWALYVKKLIDQANGAPRNK